MAKIRGIITTQEIAKLQNNGHAVTIRPRKGLVSVDGFKLYKLAPAQNTECFKCGGFQQPEDLDCNDLGRCCWQSENA